MKLTNILATSAVPTLSAGMAYDDGANIFVIGGKVTWLGPQNYDNLGVDAAELIRQAIDLGTTGVGGPIWVPEAMDPAFQAFVDAGIPLVPYYKLPEPHEVCRPDFSAPRM